MRIGNMYFQCTKRDSWYCLSNHIKTFNEEKECIGWNYQYKLPTLFVWSKYKCTGNMVNMEIKNFLESSTIHGLTYISTTSKYVRLLWTIVVIIGFTTAGVIIYQSFETWADTPISATTETRSIREITFPKVTVCPPKGTYTSLNFDLKNVENRTEIERENSIELKEYAFKQLYDEMFRRVMKNLTKAKSVKSLFTVNFA